MSKKHVVVDAVTGERVGLYETGSVLPTLGYVLLCQYNEFMGKKEYSEGYVDSKIEEAAFLYKANESDIEKEDSPPISLEDNREVIPELYESKSKIRPGVWVSLLLVVGIVLFVASTHL